MTLSWIVADLKLAFLAKQLETMNQNFLSQQLERASSAELTTFLVAASACVFVYAFSDYFKIALLAMRLPGPFAVPLIGNCLVIKEKDRKY